MPHWDAKIRVMGWTRPGRFKKTLDSALLGAYTRTKSRKVRFSMRGTNNQFAYRFYGYSYYPGMALFVVAL